MSIPSLKDLREWGYRRGEAYAYRLGHARRLVKQARAERKRFGIVDAKYIELTSQIAAARKVIKSTLCSIARWERGGCEDWKKASEQP